MIRKRFTTFCTALLSLQVYQFSVATENSHSQDAEPDSRLNQMVIATLNKYHHSKFQEAMDQALQITAQYPQNPAGPFCLLTTYQTIMRNYRVRQYEAQYDSLLDVSIELTKNALKEDNKNGINHFYLGCLYGSRSIFHAQRGKWLAAFRDGTKVLRNFNKALHYSPEFYDSYYGIGLYKYWFGAKMKVLRVLPFAKDEREEGLAQMKLAMNKGKFLNVNAMHALSTAYFNEGNYEEAMHYNDQLYETYPTNPTVLYRKGKIWQKLGQWENASSAFHELFGLLKTTEFQSVSYQVETLFRIAQCHYELGNYMKTRQFCLDAMAREKYCDFSKEIDGPLDKYSEIKDQLHDLYDEVKSILLAQGKISTGQ